MAMFHGGQIKKYLVFTVLIVATGMSIFLLQQKDSRADLATEPFREVDAAGRPDGADGLETATFAGGCFWCMEPPFKKLDGVHRVTSGYTGGHTENPTYAEVVLGNTGHVEAVQVLFDPEKISYEELLEVFWRQIDPTDDGGQFADRGTQYRTAIFVENDEQRRLAIASREKLELSGKFTKPIATEILEAAVFYEAEEYHQDYAQKNPVHYQLYRYGSGREAFLAGVWNPEQDDSPYRVLDKEQRLAELTDLQYRVTQEDHTEIPYENEYWNNKRDGIYVDVVSGEPLFSSLDKYDSHTGWPSFTSPLEPDHMIYKLDTKLFTPRIEVRSKYADSHLGHVFRDGPEPTGLRYCINSAAMRFIPKEDLAREGYEQYLALFDS